MSKEKKILKQKVYSKIDKIPRAKAIDSITEGCIVLEGGALLGLYTAGVLDGLMLMGINMQTTIGVSAGAMFGMGYVSGQMMIGAFHTDLRQAAGFLCLRCKF